MKARYIPLLLSALLFITCEKEIEFSGSKAEPKITLNGVLMADSTVSIHLSKSRFFLDSSLGFPDIIDAEVTLYSGSKTAQMKHVGNGNYTADYIPQNGEAIELKVKVSGFPSVHSSAIIPEKPAVGEVTTETSTSEYPLQNWDYSGIIDIGTSVNQTIKFKIPITDNGNEQNFYRLVVLKTQHYGEGVSRSYLSYFSDPVFEANSTEDFTGISDQSNRYNIFTDILFNGTTYQLTFSDNNLKEINLLPEYEDATYQYVIPDRVVYNIQVQQLSHDYYMYLKTRNANFNSDDNPFMEPIQIFSNIENGTGILGGAAITRRIVEVD
ncbi:MAG: DUF4249 domain-containing protein [Dysgonamonadaceae bacterium]|nr:DUF4249 domain-containing protein [Dysgonamonadaceae bacterium]MDD3901620.1 DUF4249 domain-containing protein [Dysgonamonadaceae bacterium]MDD4400074.1 DUF4249 domain-containing protein [Dysgonamonadaceae bacterium]